MKIGIIGNMNNSYFSLARYLRDDGYDCELLILPGEPSHFDPGCDTFANDYLTYCRHVAWGDPGDFLKQDYALVEEDLAQYTVLIGNGTAPAYTARIGRYLDIFIPYGFDLYAYPYPRIVHPVRQLAYLSFARYQRRGIYESHCMLFDRANKAFEAVIAKIKRSGKRIVSPAPMIYYKEYSKDYYCTETVETFQSRLKKLREENDFLLVQHTRQVWKRTPDYWSQKGNDFLLKGYAKFLRHHPAATICLVLFEYGDNVAESKKLIVQLGIQGNVVWLPKMARNELMSVIAASDLVIGELRYSWNTYGVAMEALCMGKPFLHKRIDAEFTADYPELYPMLHAHSAESVCIALLEFATHRKEIAAMGQQGREWFLTYCVNRPMNAIKKVIESKRESLVTQ